VIAALALVASQSALGQASARQTLYFVSGTPVFGRTYPVELYRAAHGRPVHVREVVPGDPDPHPIGDSGAILVADDLAGQIIAIYPGAHHLHLAVIHEDRPRVADVRTKLPTGDSFPRLVHLPSGPGLLFEEIVKFRQHAVTIIPLDKPGDRQFRPGTMQSFAGFREAGRSDPYLSPQQGIPVALRPNGLFMAYYVGDDPIGHPSASVRLTPSSPPGLQPSETGYGVLVASDKYFVIERPSATPNPVEGHWNGDPWDPTVAFSLNRRSEKWRSFTLQAPSVDDETFSRIFGDWLTTTITLFPKRNGGGDARLEEDVWHDLDGCTPAAFQPIMPDPYYDLYRAVSDAHTLTGEVQLTNLDDGRNFIFATGHPDSEVIAIDNTSQTVIYRVNAEIYSARIEGSKLGAPTLLMKGCDVQNIHWAFWSNH
jgi:hypothetical protein